MIYHIRLTNGDELFGEITEQQDHLIIDEPLCATEMDNFNGGMSIGLVNYLPFSKNNQCIIQKNHIITFSKAHPDIENFYELSKFFTEKIDESTIHQIQQINLQMSNVINMDMVANGQLVVDQSLAVH